MLPQGRGCILVSVLPGLACIVSAVLLAAEWFVFVLGYRVVPLTMCLAVVLAMLSSCSFSSFLDCTGGTSCVSVVGWFASLLAPYVLSQMVVCCVPSSSAFRGLLEVVVLSHGIWCRVAHRGDLYGEGPSPCDVLRLSWLLTSCALFSCGVMGHGAPIVLSFAVLASSQCVFLFVPQLCLEVLVVVWCVALSSCVAIGAVAYYTLSVFLFRCFVFYALRVRGRCGLFCPFRLVASCVWLLAVLVLLVAPCARARVVCSIPPGALVHCVAPWVAPGAGVGTVCCVVCLIVALTVVLQVLAAACVRVFPSRLGKSEFGCDIFPGFASVHCACGAFGLVFLWLHSYCVSLSDHEDDLGEIEWCRWTLSYVPWVVVVTTWKSWYDFVVPLHLLLFSDWVCNDPPHIGADISTSSEEIVRSDSERE
ncbi:hypothetical protein Taro_033722 [Colocasia esculenta]|uniref:Uncharacterized protein n=1 Tax=Colocasia esculenta TaxID=4460 RepID=A0A843VPG5_COLES|nr:hypothetical protein [Colocasia esculenta]